MSTILNIQASARTDGSVTRALSDSLIAKLGGDVTTRDLAEGLPFLDADWIGANFTPEDQRNQEQRDKLALSDALIAEIEAADTLVIGLPIYNFGVPASMKAWIDLVARARKTFRYTENGPVGLLTGKKAYVVVASGGTAVGSEIDFATTYLRHALGFIGITDVTLIAADQTGKKGETARQKAEEAINAVAAAEHQTQAA